GERGIADGHGRTGTLVVEGATIANGTSDATGHVSAEGAVGNGRRGGAVTAFAIRAKPGVVLNGTANAKVPRTGTERLVGGKRTIRDGQGGAAEVVDGATDAAAEEGAATAARGLVI